MNIFVGGGSLDIGNTNYNEAATKIGEYITNKGHNFIFCGCETGIIGKVFEDVSKNNNSKIFVTTTKEYIECLKNPIYTKIDVLDTINQRKDLFMKLADALVFLPGGIGTVDEIMTAIETKRTHNVNLPIIIINVDNYFNPLLEMLDKMYKEELADIKCKDFYYIANSSDNAIKYLETL